MKTFLKGLLKKLTVPVASALVTLAGTLLIQQYLLLRATPDLKKEIIRTDLVGLPPDVKNQITYVPITYTLQNISRSTAHDVTIFVKSGRMLQTPDLNFSQDSEDHQLSLPDPHELRINIPTIRPDGVVSFQLITVASNDVSFSELAENANFIVSKAEEAAQKSKNGFTFVAMGFMAFIWLPVVGGLIYVFWQAGKFWRNMETGGAQIEIRNRLILLLVGLYIYDDLVVGSTGMLQGFLPLPRINFSEIIAMFVLYLIVTRYKLLEEWIKVMIEKNKKAGQSELDDLPPVKGNPAEINHLNLK